MSLKHDNQLMLACEVSRYVQTARLNFRNAHAGPARHLSRVRGDDEGSSAAVQLAGRSFEGVQRVRIHNYIDDRRRGATLDNCAHEFGGFGVARDAWANRERLALQQRNESWFECSQ